MQDATERHLRAVMFTDVVGYTALMQEDEVAGEEVRARHRAIVEEAIASFGGQLLQYFGDGSLSIFPSAVKALSAAIAIQREARGEPDLPLRIGIHEGEIAFDAQGAYGDSVNIAARIQSLGIPGSILISEKVHDDVKNQPSIGIVPLGEFALKNVARPMEIYAVDTAGLAVPTPADVSIARGGGPGGVQLAVGASVGFGPLRVARSAVVPLLVTVGVASVLAFVLGRMLAPSDPLQVARFDVTPPGGTGLLPNVGGVDLALSPDGRRLVYVGPAPGGTQLWQRILEDLDPSPIPGTLDGRDPVFSPDGRSVAFRVGGSMRTVSLAGGAPVPVVAAGLSGPGTWGEDGYLYYPSDSDLHRIPASGGSASTITTTADGAAHRFPHLLPGGEHLLLTVLPVSPADPRRIGVAGVEGGGVSELFDGTVAKYLDPGYLVYSTAEGNLMAVRFDLGALEVIGSPTVVLRGVDMRSGPASKFALSESGALLYRTGLESSDVMEFTTVSRSGRATQVDGGWTFDPGPDNRGWDVSPGGDRIALKARTDLGSDIWIKEIAGSGMSRFSFGDGEERMPRWAPDSSTIVFLSDERGGLDVWSKRADGSGAAELLLDHANGLADIAWSPDGEWLLLRTGGTAGIVGGRDILGFRPGVDSVAQAILATPADESAPAVSPDGRWLAYQSDETGRREVFIRPFPNVNAGKWQVSTRGGRSAVWSHEGTELYFVGNVPVAEGGGRRLMVAGIRPGPPFSVGPAEALFTIEDNYYFANNTTSYVLLPDGEHFLMARYPGEEARVQLVLVVNFVEELRAKLGG